MIVLLTYTPEIHSHDYAPQNADSAVKDHVAEADNHGLPNDQ